MNMIKFIAVAVKCLRDALNTNIHTQFVIKRTKGETGEIKGNKPERAIKLS